MKRALFLLFFIPFTTLAQERVTIDDTVKVEYSLASKTLKFQRLEYDNSQGFQQYRAFRTNGLPIARSGNLGLPVHLFKIDYQSWNTDHHIGGYQPYLFKKENILYYKTTRPFTQLSYVNGAESEQQFQVLHTQNIGEGLNISFEYQRITSEGFYIRQLTNHTQFNASYNLKNRSGRFHSRGYYLINALETQENGGIILSLDDNQEDNTVLLDINLREAQNQIRSNSVGTKNEYDLIGDSNSTILNLSHEFNWTKSYRKYQDDTTGSNGFYENFFLNEVQTADSSFTQVVENEFKLNTLNKQLSIGVLNSQYHYYQNSLIDRSFATNYIVADFSREFFNQQTTIEFKKGISGFYKENLMIKAQVDLEEIQGFLPSLMVRSTSSRGDYLLLNQRSNHFFFREDLETSDAISYQLNLVKSKWDLDIKLGYNQFENYIYYDSTQSVNQHNSTISSFYAEINKKFHFLKHWNFNNKIRYQSNSAEEIIPLPKLYSYHSLFYENTFFKKSLFFQIGVDGYYIGEYKGYAYSPSLAQFYNQSSNNQLGNIFQLDVFINMRVNRSARIFLKMENILNNSFAAETYRIQNYPIPGRALKVGLSWRMIN